MSDFKVTINCKKCNEDFSLIHHGLIDIDNDKDELIFTKATDSEGKIVIPEIPYGKYAPEGYKLNPDKMWFEIKEDGQIVKCTMKDEIIVSDT